MSSNRFATGMAYYGLTYNTGTIGGNIYINFFFSVLVECIGYSSCLILSSKLGRKITHCGSLILAGVGCLLTIFTVLFAGEGFASCRDFKPCNQYRHLYFVDYIWITVGLSMIGKCGVSATYGNIYIFTPELFPTYLRSSILGASNVAAKIGILVSPYIANIADFVEKDTGNAIALSIFGFVTIAAGLISLTLPETVNKKLPETIDEALELSGTHGQDCLNKSNQEHC
ncbi:hypothetical protein KUTeg_019916 [Tegillarca granosa]|uniref:Major facilitator superfamily (MFS) profile domain-containing protein n=1 Tax=Tegillarca granosa TaxID=220873 RepID=A0ABQ9EJ12_TEGGR|nr:hypothetical protein KUTeg_019916 [Tegillarca granosa]